MTPLKEGLMNGKQRIELLSEAEILRDAARGYENTIRELRAENQSLINSLARAREVLKAFGVLAREIAED
jgi:prophage DNA circulation protein